MPAVPAFGELPIAVGFKAADFCVFILGSRGIFHKIGKSPFPMPAQGFSKDEPALGLGENPDIYGKNIEVQLLDFDRPEQRFAGLDALKERIELDKQYAEEYFRKHPCWLQGESKGK